jgi:CheY-like chemotaxis protein
MKEYATDRLHAVEHELIYLGLMDKAREIYGQLGRKPALSYIKSSYHLLSKIYHPDLNPGHEDKANDLQQRLNNATHLINQTGDEDLIGLLEKGMQSNGQGKKKILIVEDEFGLQEMFRDVLLMEGYDVRYAVDGEEGYHIYLEFLPDLIFTDVVMPKMSGLELVRKIRQNNPKIKVIYTSGFLGLKNIKKALNEEVREYGYPCLPKPFKISALLELVNTYFNDQNNLDYYA